MVLLVGAWVTTANAEAPNTVSIPEFAYVEEVYVQTPKPTVVMRPRRLYLNNLGQCSCVEYIKARIGFTGTFGNAKDVQPDSKVPTVGSVILFKNHVGLVTWVDLISGLAQYDDFNYISCTERRGVVIKIDDPSIRGFK